MKKREFLKESAKAIKSISEGTVELLKTITEETKVLDFDNMDDYHEIQILVKEGYVDKDYRHYSLSEKGKELLEGVSAFKKDPKQFEKVVNADNKNQIVIEYKHHDEEKNIIENAIASFDVEKDGLPVIVVTEDAYAGLIHRQKGQHWRQYLGEDGRNLIRQKKVTRFYVEDASTGRRYLYLSPKI